MDYYMAKAGPVDHYATKYDNCTLRATGKEYKFQKGSGRSEVINRFAEDGLTLGEMARRAAEAGFEPNFTVDACMKHAGSKDSAWLVDAPEGTTLEEIKATRAERQLSPEQQEARDAKAEEKARTLEEKRIAKAEREQAKEQELAERRAEAAAARAEVARLKAMEKAEARAKTKHEDEIADLVETPAKNTKGKRKSKAPVEEADQGAD